MIRAQWSGLRAILDDNIYAIEESITAATVDAMAGLKEDLRDQIISAGLGVRMSKTWRGKVYPENRASLEPAAYVWSKAPTIVIAFNTGGTISPRHSRFFAIPTNRVPRGRGRNRRTPMTPAEVEHEFNQDLIMRPGRNGSFLGFIEAVEAKSRRRKGYRQATKGRLAQGRQAKLIHMFTFVRRVKQPKLLNLQAAADRWAARMPVFFTRRMARVTR